MEHIVLHARQEAFQPRVIYFAGVEIAQELDDLRLAGVTHVDVVRLVGGASGRRQLLPRRHVGCHHLPASTTPAETSFLSPINLSPMQSV
jgi:hypothetical protein